MTTIATCSNDAEASLLKSMLEAHGLTVYSPDELTSQAAVHFAGSGLRLQVSDEEAAQARRILAEAEAAEPAEEETDEED